MNNFPTYSIWFIAIWATLQMNSCSQIMTQHDIIKELREIKQEIRK